jgi:hypothetical protein
VDACVIDVSIAFSVCGSSGDDEDDETRKLDSPWWCWWRGGIVQRSRLRDSLNEIEDTLSSSRNTVMMRGFGPDEVELVAIGGKSQHTLIETQWLLGKESETGQHRYQWSDIVRWRLFVNILECIGTRRAEIRLESKQDEMNRLFRTYFDFWSNCAYRYWVYHISREILEALPFESIRPFECHI